MGMAAEYAGARQRIQDLVRGADERDLATRVPACPAWNVKELVAHVTGVAVDSLAMDLAGAGQAGWTQAQVDARRDKPLEDIVAEWNETASQIEAGLDDLHPTAASMLIGDVVTHEHDLRGALGRPSARDTEGVVIAASFYARNFGKRLKDAGLPTIIVRGDGHEWIAGREEPQGEVSAPLFEMLRGLTGRRTLDEIKAFDWSIDAAPYLDLFAMYPLTDAPLDE